ncbi:cell division protein FtsQ/DivIB [Glycomyces buryatensis]|uniref:FtsQ-type POTRA domain-containing protein n=1 Tax=Glycomyces buryatensis TaxID=2570927 RepID=A0A4S8Q832_9ACTN|nr:FtsQ-type POTRA domain-containing protein [Glycomyces buryatensis]THV39521.1 FtsQ-type POTRA domain-containing protein [Glycomyces buryatensis]
MRGPDKETESGPWRLVHVVRRRLPNKRLRLIVAIAAALALTAFVIVWATPPFAVKDLQVTGTSVLDPKEVAEVASEARGQSILRADLDEIAAAVAELPPVKSVEVSRSWPSAVLIEVNEREPFLAVPQDDETFLMIDSEGVVFDEAEEITGPIWNVELAEPGPSDLATIETIKVLQDLPSSLADKVQRVESPSPAGVTLYLEDGRTLQWGDASENDQKARVADRLLASGYEHVDVSAPDAPTVS